MGSIFTKQDGKISGVGKRRLKQVGRSRCCASMEARPSLRQVPKTLFILFIHLPAFKQPQQPI